MTPRVPRRAWRSRAPGHRPRILIEDSHAALAISDFSLFEQAGFDVAVCSGPGRDPGDCPVLHGRECAALAGADAVLHNLDPDLGIAGAIRSRYPDKPVVMEVRRQADGSLPPVPEGCVPLVYPCSVQGQIDALWRVITDRHRRAAT